MKILVIPSWYPPKSGHFFQELSEALHSENNQVDVLVNTNTSLKKFEYKNLFKKNVFHNESGLYVYRSVFYKIPKLNFLSSKLWVRKTYKLYLKYSKTHGHPDIIHTHSSMWAGVVAEKIHKRFSIPYVISEHRGRFVYNTEESKKLLASKYLPLIQKALKKASLITCVSPALCPKLIDIEPSVKEKLNIIPNTIDSENFTLSTLKHPETEFIWFSLGKLYPVKGFDILLKALKIVKSKSDKNVSLKIGGDGEDYKKLSALKKSLNLDTNVTFLGHLNKKEVISEMQDSHAFVLSSRFEAFGVVFIEANACGLPIVGTNVGGPSYIINKQNGVSVESENPEKLAEGMLFVMENYSKYNKQEIRNMTIKKYDKHHIAKKYCDEFSKIISGEN